MQSDENADRLFKIVRDGVVLAKLINVAEPGTIDERALNKGNLNNFSIGENQTLVVNSAAAIGVNVTNIGPSDLSAGTPHIVLGLLWQIIRIGLFNKINIKECPGLSALLLNGEELKDLLALSPEVRNLLLVLTFLFFLFLSFFIYFLFFLVFIRFSNFFLFFLLLILP